MNNVDYIELLSKIIPTKDINWWIQNHPNIFNLIEKTIMKPKS